jgi:hypothetical protein
MNNTVVKEHVIYIFFQENEVLEKENHNVTEHLSRSEETRVQLQKELESLAGLQQRVCIPQCRYYVQIVF